MKILINASNLHVGGGVQVACSFITELTSLLKVNRQAYDISVLCSQKVYENLPQGFEKSVFSQFSILNIYGLNIPTFDVRKKFKGYDVCFTVFGPLYFRPKVKFHICGFAQAWIAYPNNIAYQQLSLKEYLKNKIKFKLQSIFFRQYHHLIVEQEHVKNALCRIGFNFSDISVVNNCVSSIYDNNNSWVPLIFDDSCLIESITLGFIGRAYTHKNLKILNQVNELLISKYNIKCNFLFTLNKEEMKLCGFTYNSNFHTVGEISASQCPAFYNRLDALVFPSLLECFSASPIEAIKMDTPVIASDYPFVREICGEAAFYFDPLNADDIAASIFYALTDSDLRDKKKKLAQELANNLPTAKDRAISYLNIIKNSFKSNY